MRCKRYSSKEEYYGIDGDVPAITSPFWDCEPEEEEVREAFLEWMFENGEILERDFPREVRLFCEECGEWVEFDYVPSDVFSDEELLKINRVAVKKWLDTGEIDDEDYKAITKDLEKMFKKGE